MDRVFRSDRRSHCCIKMFLALACSSACRAGRICVDDAAEPDYEVLNAIRPSMVTIPNAMLLCASSPYGRRGALHEAHRKHFGVDGDLVLVWQAATRTMNPTVPPGVIDTATERDARVSSHG
jgi:hypothetical protein